ncbi:MAG: hypothetical protein KatS3mg008_1763 [Acidimicrobiales bacterium]|nr:MAG: hypothetical protein KatS3mg008_1763 [Acidimicrobiales bacterium]
MARSADGEGKALRDVAILEKVLAGLEALEVAETPEERRAAIAQLPSSTGQDAELDALLEHIRSSSIFVDDFGMSVKLALARARYLRRLTAPTKLRRRLPILYGRRPQRLGPRDAPADEGTADLD